MVKRAMFEGSAALAASSSLKVVMLSPLVVVFDVLWGGVGVGVGGGGDKLQLVSELAG